MRSKKELINFFTVYSLLLTIYYKLFFILDFVKACSISVNSVSLWLKSKNYHNEKENLLLLCCYLIFCKFFFLELFNKRYQCISQGEKDHRFRHERAVSSFLCQYIEFFF